MATLVLGIAGSAIGSAVVPGGLSLFGATLTGKMIGGAVGAVAGSVVDQTLLGPLASATGQASVPAGPRLTDLKLGTSSEGTPPTGRRARRASASPRPMSTCRAPAGTRRETSAARTKPRNPP